MSCLEERQEDKCKRSIARGYLRGGTHVPLGFQAVVELISGPDDIFWYATNAICPGANAMQLLSRHRTAVAAYTASIRGGLASLESGWRCEVKGGKGARFSQQVAVTNMSKVKSTIRNWEYLRAWHN